MTNSNQSFQQAIILDFEMNPVAKGNNNKLSNEIIEIGAIKIIDNEVVDRFQSFVKPAFSNNISPTIRRLTNINESNLRHAPYFSNALHIFSEWIGGGNTKFYAWSESDYQQFQAECLVKQVEPPSKMKEEWEDLQVVYHQKMGADITKKKTALKKAAEQSGIPMDKRLAHRAPYDADITAQIFLLLNTGRFQKQAAILRDALQENHKKSSNTMLGDICRSFFDSVEALEIFA